MDKHAGVYRTGESMQEGLDKIADLKQRFRKITIQDKSRIYNTNLIQALETENMLELAEVLLFAGLAREESRGGACPNGFLQARRREVPGPLHGLLHGRQAATGLQARDDYELEASGTKVLKSWHGHLDRVFVLTGGTAVPHRWRVFMAEIKDTITGSGCGDGWAEGVGAWSATPTSSIG